jgi:signal transduction histidine kinase
MLFNIVAILCNYKGFYAMSKTVLLAANSIILFLFVNIVEGNSSAVAFFFPVLCCYVVFYDVVRELRIVLINLAITSVCILLCLTLPEHTLGRVSLPPYMSGNITRMNYLLAFTAFAFYVLTIIKVKLQSETLLIQSIQTAEIMANKSDAVLVQITAQKEKAEQATKTKAKFLAEVSDEIKQPLEEIIGGTNLIGEKNPTPEIRAELDQLRKASTNIMATLSDVRELHEMEAGKMKMERKVFRLEPVLNKLKDLASNECTIGFQADDHAMKDIISDEKKLQQLLQIVLEQFKCIFHPDEISVSVQSESIRKDNMMLAFVVSCNTKNNNLSHPTPAGNIQGFRLALCERLAEMLGGRLTITPSADLIHASFKIPVKLVSTDGK